MKLPPLLIAGIETALNAVLYRDRSLKAARQRLNGKVLSIQLQEIDHPLVLVFSEHQLDILQQWEDQADCTVALRLSTLPKLRDRQQLTALIRAEELDVQGDLRVVQHFSAMMDLAELDPAEYLAPWTGDVLAETLSQGVKSGISWLKADATRKHRYLAETLTEEWRVAPGALELAWYAEEVEATQRELESLEARLDKMELR